MPYTSESSLWLIQYEIILKQFQPSFFNHKSTFICLSKGNISTCKVMWRRISYYGKMTLDTATVRYGGVR
jgi:hypothetical protein